MLLYCVSGRHPSPHKKTAVVCPRWASPYHPEAEFVFPVSFVCAACCGWGALSLSATRAVAMAVVVPTGCSHPRPAERGVRPPLLQRLLVSLLCVCFFLCWRILMRLLLFVLHATTTVFWKMSSMTSIFFP